MDRESFYAGLGMLLAPFLLYLIYNIIQLDINWTGAVFGIVVLAYVGVALFLIVKGALTKN